MTADWRARFDAVVGELERFPLAVLQLMFRVGVGGVFWNSGQGKIAS